MGSPTNASSVRRPAKIGALNRSAFQASSVPNKRWRDVMAALIVEDIVTSLRVSLDQLTASCTVLADRYRLVREIGSGEPRPCFLRRIRNTVVT